MFLKPTQCELCDNRNCYSRGKRNINFSSHNVCVSFVKETIKIFDDNYSIVKNSDNKYTLKNKDNETKLIIKWTEIDDKETYCWVVGDKKYFLVSERLAGFRNYEDFLDEYGRTYDDYLYYFFVAFIKLNKFIDLDFILEVTHNSLGVYKNIEDVLLDLKSIPLLIEFIKESNYYGYPTEDAEEFIVKYGNSNDMWRIAQDYSGDITEFTKKFIQKAEKEFSAHEVCFQCIDFLSVVPNICYNTIENFIIEKNNSTAAYLLAYNNQNDHFINVIDLELVIIKNKDSYTAVKFLIDIKGASRKKLEPIIKLDKSNWEFYLDYLDKKGYL